MKIASSAIGLVICTVFISVFISPSHAQNSTCESKRTAGDYNCDNVINLVDFESFRRDFVANKTTLVYFEAWRRAMFGVAPTTATQNKSALITQTLQTVSKQNIINTVASIADDDDTPGIDATQTRWSNSSGNQTERAYVTREFEKMGYTVTSQSFSFGSVNTANVIARLNGKDNTKRYLVTAHLDSTAARSGTNDPAPGADDNGSGTATVLEAARVLKLLSSQLKYSVEFILFSGEEQGLYGSDYYVSRVSDPASILGVFNMDMIGWNPASRGDCVQFGYIARNGGNVLSDAASMIDRTYNIQLKADSVLTNILASDHAPFVRRNIKAILIAECALMEARVGTAQPNYHSVNDVPSTLNYNQIQKTAKTIIGTIIELAY